MKNTLEMISCWGYAPEYEADRPGGYEGKKPPQRGPIEGGRKMTRAAQNAYECWDEENKEFDWEEYQKLCDIAEYLDCEE